MDQDRQDLIDLLKEMEIDSLTLEEIADAVILFFAIRRRK